MRITLHGGPDDGQEFTWTHPPERIEVDRPNESGAFINLMSRRLVAVYERRTGERAEYDYLRTELRTF